VRKYVLVLLVMLLNLYFVLLDHNFAWGCKWFRSRNYGILNNPPFCFCEAVTEWSCSPLREHGRNRYSSQL